MKSPFWRKKRFYSWLPILFILFLVTLGRFNNGPDGLGFLVVFPIIYGIFTVAYTLFFSINMREALFTALFVFLGIFLGLIIFSAPNITLVLLLETFVWGLIYGILAILIGVIKIGVKKLIAKIPNEEESED